MQGIIFNLLESIVVRDLGANTWNDLLDAAGLGGVYTAFDNYPERPFKVGIRRLSNSAEA